MATILKIKAILRNTENTLNILLYNASKITQKSIKNVINWAILRNVFVWKKS